MNSPTTLTIQDFALFWGGPCEVHYPMVPIAFRSTIDSVSFKTNQVYISAGRFPENKFDGWIDPENVRPILRPLSSLTEQEAQAMYAEVTDQPWEEKDDWACLDWWDQHDEDWQPRSEYALGNTKIWRWLLVHHFDLFGWIESGLAIKAENP